MKSECFHYIGKTSGLPFESCFRCAINILIRKPVFFSSATQFWRKKVLEVANDHRDVTFAIADEQSFMEELKDFALDDSGEEVNVGCFDDKDKKYRMDPDEEFDEDSLREFVENFKEGKNPSLLVKTCF